MTKLTYLSSRLISLSDISFRRAREQAVTSEISDFNAVEFGNSTSSSCSNMSVGIIYKVKSIQSTARI